MIDEAIVGEALRDAWEKTELSEWGSLDCNHDYSCRYPRHATEERVDRYMTRKLDEGTESARKLYYSELAERIPPRLSRTLFSVEDVAELIRKAAPGLTIRDTEEGIAVDVPGDSIGISVNKKYRVSVYSRDHHVSWNATMWESEDTAAAVVAMGRFEELSVPLKEGYRERIAERMRRAGIQDAFGTWAWGIRPSVCSALKEGADTGALRKAYLERRKSMYEEIGDPWDEATPEKDWKAFEDGIRDELATIRRMQKREKEYQKRQKVRQERKETQRQMRLAYIEELARKLGRDCSLRRCAPSDRLHWDEYTVWLDGGQEVRFRDFTRQTGSIEKDIIALVPALEGLLPFAQSRFKIVSSFNPSTTYSPGNRTRYRKLFLEMAGDDEVMLHLDERMKVLKSHVMLIPGKRSVKLYCYHPKSDRDSLSFTLVKLSDKQDADLLVDAVRNFCSVMRKHPCNLG